MIKPIPTTYNGTQFRSRLEARYAKAFDSYSVRWVYEVEGYEYDGVRYLPDFYLPAMNVLLEVKGPTIPGTEKPANLRKLLESRNLSIEMRQPSDDISVSPPLFPPGLVAAG
jgi:hypothetical protein